MGIYGLDAANAALKLKGVLNYRMSSDSDGLHAFGTKGESGSPQYWFCKGMVNEF